MHFTFKMKKKLEQHKLRLTEQFSQFSFQKAQSLVSHNSNSGSYTGKHAFPSLSKEV